MNVKRLQEERTQLFMDLYDGKIPERIPIELQITWDAAIAFSKMNLKDAQWDKSQYRQFYDKCCSYFDTDKAPVGRTLRTPQFYQILESRPFVMSETGSIQHPEIHCLEVEEYDAFIEDPYNYMVEVLLPRLYPALDGDKMKTALTFAKAYKAYHDSNAVMGAIGSEMNEKYGFAVLPPGGVTEAPMDLLADLIRSFSGIVMDIRRVPDKVEAACKVLLALCKKIAVTKTSSKYGRTFIPLHMAPFLSEKQFKRFWWPTFLELMQYMDAKSTKANLFCEQDWSKKLDYLKELPEKTTIWFEFGDPKIIKNKLGDRHIITGLYPVSLLQTGTKQECVDEAKRLMDILAPGGGYIFNTDKIIYSLNDTIADNLKAVVETVKTYGVY